MCKKQIKQLIQIGSQQNRITGITKITWAGSLGRGGRGAKPSYLFWAGYIEKEPLKISSKRRGGSKPCTKKGNPACESRSVGRARDWPKALDSSPIQ